MHAAVACPGVASGLLGPIALALALGASTGGCPSRFAEVCAEQWVALGRYS